MNDRGLSYYSRIAPPLEQISAASTAFQQKASGAVCLSLSQTLAAKWLGPRLGDFVSRYPEVEVHINASNSPVNFAQEAVDLAIRHFDGKAPSLSVQLLYGDEVRLFCTPAYRDALDLRHPNQLLAATLIITRLYQYWDDWLSAFSSIESEARRQITALHFDQAMLAIDAAKRGQGVVLSNPLLVQEELKSGELVEPFPHRLSLNKGYYLVHPNLHDLSPSARILKDWLLQQFSQSNASDLL
ncbi:LysR substrate-binding domain-containing protein [Marinobacterium jannaschii]|uniref:LysR substrate-binding domain-containing protein n=1 Tax=Marinobacterium jannaschii TaxID=64970 RepID=UPI000AE184BD|nr:LysR substrate-binding domain-containing protein [Marinobacterium jannaschii]